MTTAILILALFFVFVFIAYSIIAGIKTDKEIKAIEAEYDRTQPKAPWWEDHKLNTRPVDESPVVPTRTRIPADPIDAINIHNPTLPTLRDEYKLMIRMRG